MIQKIIIIGGLPIDHDRAALLAKLRAASGDSYAWEWIRADAQNGWRPPEKLINGLGWSFAQKVPDGSLRDKIALLHRLNGKTKNAIFRLVDPIKIPESIEDGDELVDWLLSPDAGIVPPIEWMLTPCKAALVCILIKLLKNKSFNKDTQGHAWTQEANLLGQSPVSVPDRPAIRAAAVDMLPGLHGGILIAKGGYQGKTKKEWCINTAWLPAVKRVVLERSFSAFETAPALAALMNQLNEPNAELHAVHDFLAERVLSFCRERPREPP
jgi:hypothetical protein